MEQKRYEEIMSMVRSACNSNYINKDDIRGEIVKATTQIYIEQMRIEAESDKPTVTKEDKVRIQVIYIDTNDALGYKHKEFPGYADFTMWACEESNRFKDGLKIIGMTVKIGED